MVCPVCSPLAPYPRDAALAPTGSRTAGTRPAGTGPAGSDASSPPDPDPIVRTTCLDLAETSTSQVGQRCLRLVASA